MSVLLPGDTYLESFCVCGTESVMGSGLGNGDQSLHCIYWQNNTEPAARVIRSEQVNAAKRGNAWCCWCKSWTHWPPQSHAYADFLPWRYGAQHLKNSIGRKWNLEKNIYFLFGLDKVTKNNLRFHVVIMSISMYVRGRTTSKKAAKTSRLVNRTADWLLLLVFDAANYYTLGF